MSNLVLWTGATSKLLLKYVKPVLQPLQQAATVQPLNKGRLPNVGPGDVCLAMGQKAVEVLQEAKLVPKNRKVGSLRGTMIESPGGAKFLVTFDPNLLEFDYARKPELEWDLMLAHRVVSTGSMEAPLGDYQWVNDFSDLVKRTEKMYAKSGAKVPVSLDLETVGLDPWADDVFIVSISLSIIDGESRLIRFSGPTDKKQPAVWMTPTEPDPWSQNWKITNKKLLDQIIWFCNSEKVSLRGANLKFDMTWMYCHWGIQDYDSFNIDTTLLGSLIDENRSNSLNTHAKIYTQIGGYDDEFNKSYDKGRMDLVPDGPLLGYAGGDTDACLQVSNKMRSALLTKLPPSQPRFYVNLVHPAAKAFQVIERRGMYVDRGKYLQLKDKVQHDIEMHHQNIIDMMPRRLRIKHRENLSLGRAAVLNDFLFSPKGMNLKPMMVTEKTQAPSTAMEHFEMLRDHHTDNEELAYFVDQMSQYNSASKTMSTYIVGFMKHIRADGKFHPSYMLHRGDYGGGDAGTVTGRTSAKDPAYQTIPKHTKWAKALREVYVPPPGHVILNVDYSQGELRVAACVSQEKTMITAYKNGLDLHSITAAKLVGMSFEEFMSQDPDWIAAKRSGGKAGNFGLLYGMSANGFQEYARKTYGVYLTDKEAEDFRHGFLYELYPGLSSWHEETKKRAAKLGYVQSPLGRIRHLPLIGSRDNSVRAKQERQSINSPIQSTLSDLGLLASADLNEQYPDLYAFGFTHDALSFYVPEDSYDVWGRRIKDVMENLDLKGKFGWNPPLQFLVDVEMGVENLATCKAIEV